MAASQAVLWRPSFWLSHRRKSFQTRRVLAPCFAITSDAASFLDSVLHFDIQQAYPSSSNLSLELWMPAALLWFSFATPSSLLGVADYIGSPIHSVFQKEFPPEDVEVGKKLGEGSFGVVYDGMIRKGNDTIHVILKKAKPQVSGASEMQSSEVHMNHYLQRNASEAVAKFLGTTNVKPSQTKGKLTEGVWLVWKFQGYYSLDHFMKKKNFPANVPEQVFGNEGLKDDVAFLRMIMFQLLSNLKQIHKVGVVHRDVKPLNVILAEDSNEFKLVDFGACVNLRSGYNYSPRETVMDPIYAAPEQYVMPTSTPRLPPEPLCSIISPFVWLLNTPDRFDIFSAGLIMMQLAVKPLRSDIAMKKFTEDLRRAGYDLKKWRRQCQIGDKEFRILDADGRSGWELVAELLLPRPDKNFVVWPSLLNSRPSASAALRYRFFRTHLEEFDIIRSTSKLFNIRTASVPALMAFPSNLVAAWTKLKPEGQYVLQKLKAVDMIYVSVTAIAFSTAFIIASGLHDSLQMTYEVGRKSMDYILIFSVFTAAGLFVKPLLLKMQPSTPLLQRSKSDFAEISNLAEAINAMDDRLSRLEASIYLEN